MSSYNIKIVFSSPVRVGIPGRDDQATRISLPADQIFSWLSLGWIRVYGLEDYKVVLLEPLLNSKYPIVLSDLFPYSNGKLWIPSFDLHGLSSTKNKQSGKAVDETGTKKLKNKWMSLDSLFRYVSKASSQIDYEEPMKSAMMANVQIRNQEDNIPFYTAAVIPSCSSKGNIRDKDSEFTPSANYLSYYGWIKCEEPRIVEKLENVLDYLADEGFGGNRSSGLGSIESANIIPLKKEFVFPEQTEARQYLLLSNCVPTEQMIQNIKNSLGGTNSYKLISKSGWIYDSNGRATDQKKPNVFMFETGSIFAQEPEGKVLSVGTEQYPSYKYGVPFYIGV